MIIFPALDLMNGNVVKLESTHHAGQEKIYGGPGAVADRWLNAGAKWLHIVDLNAALGKGTPNHLSLLTLLPKLAKHGARLQWGGGVRDASILRALLDAELGGVGAKIDCVITGTRAVKDTAWLESAADSYPDRVIVAIDAVGREIMVGGWQEKAGIDAVDFVKETGNLSIAGFLYTNVAVEGKGEGVDWTPIQEVIEASPKPVTIAGGVTTLDDVGKLKDLGAHGVIIGSALYAGRIDFAEALKIAG